mgnify:CR=1 FL=1
MAISDKIKALMKIRRKGNGDLAEYLGISTQALSNKLYRGSFSAADLIRVATCLDCELAITGDDGNKITFVESDLLPSATSDRKSVV